MFEYPWNVIIVCFLFLFFWVLNNNRFQILRLKKFSRPPKTVSPENSPDLLKKRPATMPSPFIFEPLVYFSEMGFQKIPDAPENDPAALVETFFQTLRANENYCVSGGSILLTRDYQKKIVEILMEVSANFSEELRIADLRISGHSYHCACRMVWGDGECECGDYPEAHLKTIPVERILQLSILNMLCDDSLSVSDLRGSEVRAVKMLRYIRQCGYDIFKRVETGRHTCEDRESL